MQNTPNEIRRSGQIFILFLREFLSRLAIGALIALAGIGIFFIGKQLDIHAIKILGEVVILGGTIFAAWHALAAEFRAVARLQRWGKYSEDC